MESGGELPHLRLRVLGGLRVEGLDDHAVGSRKARRLLKVLAVARGASVPTDRIVDALWGDRTPGRPADQVGVLVSRLRSVLGSHRLSRSDAGYALAYDWLDLVELESRVTEAERRHATAQLAAARAAAEAALALVRGPLLPEEDGEWVDTERVVAERLAHRARLVLAEVAVAGGDCGTAVTAAEALLVADPYDEAALRALMRAHAAAGSPGSALAAYADLRARLADDLGVPPGAATEALHDAIVLGHQTGPRATVPPAPALVGREPELAVLAEAAADAGAGGGVLVVVEGEPGIGKTALLDAAAAAAAGRHPELTVVRCRVDPVGRSLPLQPVLDGLAALLQALPADVAAAALGPDAPVLEPLLGWRPSDAPTATVLSDPEAGRSLLCSALLATLVRAAGGGPLLVTVDDLHLADAATLVWIQFAVHRGRSVAVFAARRLEGAAAPPGARVLRLGPLDAHAAALVVGADRGPDLHARSGGNPFFLIELAGSVDAVPAGIRDSVDERATRLGAEAAQTVRLAAVLGSVIDLDLLAGILHRPLPSLLDDADAAVTGGLLQAQGTTYVFRHELVREALVAGMTAARRAFFHREAARVLAARGRPDARLVAWHARRGGDQALAARALLDVAGAAAARYDHDEAERSLVEAVALDDGPEVRLARARLRMARWDTAGAAEDAERALAMGAGAAGLEVAGWIAYYRRDYEAAQRHADEGAVRAADEALRASCLALAGRTRHSLGAVREAEPRLVEAAACRVVEVRSVAQVWLAALRAHQGEAGEARDLAERALVEPARFGHPFGPFHGAFVRALALGMQGRIEDLLEVSTGLERDAERAGPQGARFVPIALNLRAWPLRAVGRVSEALDLLDRGLDRCPPGTPALAEPRHVGRLDAAETVLAGGSLDAALRELDRSALAFATWEGTMVWRARQRLQLLRARAWLAAGDLAAAEHAALVVVEGAEAASNARHGLMARCVAAEAVARGGGAVDPQLVDGWLARLDACAGLEAWLVTARLAAACGVDRWWRDAERRAGRVVRAAGPLADDARRHVDRSLAALR